MDMNEAVDDLQSSLAQIDLFTRQSSGSGFIEFLVIRKQNLKVKMYQEQGHSEPHIHIDYGRQNHVASFAIRDGRLLSGSLDRKYKNTISGWIDTHRDSLVNLWATAQLGEPVDEIIVGIRGA